MISLLVPTMNRSPFMARLLNYYAATRFGGTVVIGDSSGAAHLEATRHIIGKFGDRLRIVHQEYPGLNNAQCIHLMLKLVSTPYAAFIADDDFLVPASLERCAEFLASHPEYSAAHGVGVTMVLEGSGPWGRPVVTGYYAQAEIKGQSARERVEEYKRNPLSTLFCVHRSETLRQMYANVSAIPDIAIGTEILPCYLTVVHGKVKSLEGLHVIRQIHDQQYVYRDDPIVWLTRPEWYPSFKIFCDAVGEAISSVDGIPRDEAFTFVQKHYRARLPRYLGAKAAPSPLVRAARRAAGTFKQRVLERRFRLRSLMAKSSPYYPDFARIYEAVTERPS